MTRVTFLLRDNDQYINVEAEEFHQDGDFLKAYTVGHELVAVVHISAVKAAYRTKERR